MNVTLKNYRCFSDEKPITLQLRNGFTAFVGANNSGKSTLLRFPYELRDLFSAINLRHGGTEFFQSTIEGGTGSFNYPRESNPTSSVFCNRNDRGLSVTFSEASSDTTEPRAGRSTVWPDSLQFSVRRNSAIYKTSIYKQGVRIPLTNIAPGDDSEVWIAPQRSADLARFIDEVNALRNALYIGPFRNALNLGANESYYDIAVGQAFVKRWHDLKAGGDPRQNEIAFQVLRDLEQIFGFKNLDINTSPDGQTFQLTIDSKSYRLHEVATGFVQFFMTLANVASMQPSYVLIDEPELGLHPTLQQRFLNTLGSYAKRGVFFSTHSMGLARSIADQIYAVSRTQDGQHNVNLIEKTQSISSFLGELSYSGFSEIGFSKLLLVEGPTETKVFQTFLRMLKKDHQVLIQNLGGSSMINGHRASDLEELKRITPHIYAVIDSEKSNAEEDLQKARGEFVSACKTASINCHVLGRRATENYFTERALKAVYGKRRNALEQFEKLGSSESGWPKTENWRIAREMTLDELLASDLGAFLKNL